MAKAATPPDGHRVKLFTSHRLGDRRVLAAVLDALDAAGATPTHSGKNGRGDDPFDRDALVATVTGGKQPVFALIRRKAPTYTAILRAQKSGLTTLSIEMNAKLKDPSLPYQLGDALAAVVEAAYGVVHPSYDGHGVFNSAGAIELGWLQDFGPLRPAARTWYGAHLRKLLGGALADTGGAQSETAWGALRVDLIAEPWTADRPALEKRQREVEKILAATGVPGDYSHAVKYKRGARWTPIPDAS